MSARSFPAMGEGMVLTLAALAVSVAAGAFAAHVNILWVLGVVGVSTAGALALSREATLWFVVITGIVVTGVCLLYVPGAGYFKYIPPLASAALLVHTASDWLQSPRTVVPSTVPLLGAFLGISGLAMAANWQGFGMALEGLKTYYPMWTLFIALALIRWRPEVIDSLPRVALWLAFLQLPFVLQQFLVLVPMRQNIPGVVPVDIVAGTFGGDKFGGGANSVMTVFLIIVCACLLGVWRRGGMSAGRALGSVALLLSPVFVDSARAALIYLPLVFLMVFYGDIIRHPVRTLVGFCVVVGLVFALLMSYTALNQTPHTRTWQDLVRNTYEYQFATERERSQDYSGLSRWTVLTFWASKQRQSSLMETLFGHGPGASRVDEGGIDLAKTLAETRYGGRQIGYTALAALLWDVGVVGLLSVLALFWAGFRQARCLVRYYGGRDPVRAGVAEGLSAGMVVLVLSLAHKDFFVFHIPYQTMVVCILGYLAAQIRRIEAGSPTGVHPHPVPVS